MRSLHSPSSMRLAFLSAFPSSSFGRFPTPLSRMRSLMRRAASAIASESISAGSSVQAPPAFWYSTLTALPLESVAVAVPAV